MSKELLSPLSPIQYAGERGLLDQHLTARRRDEDSKVWGPGRCSFVFLLLRLTLVSLNGATQPRTPLHGASPSSGYLPQTLSTQEKKKDT